LVVPLSAASPVANAVLVDAIEKFAEPLSTAVNETVPDTAATADPPAPCAVIVAVSAAES